MRAWLTALLLALAAPAFAQDGPAVAQQVELERARAELADQVQLSVYDLVDELVYQWTQAPVFADPTPVVLAGVTVPVGLGTGLSGLVENHLAGVILANPRTQVQLVHCPTCSATVVHSGPESTVVSRGIDDPELLAKLGADTGRYALFVDVAAEGSWLVLRARITRLSPELPIVWSHTITAPVSAPSLLRDPGHLTSADEARQAYLDLLRGRGPITIPVRFNLRTFAPGWDGGGVPPPPLVWLETGVEFEPTPGSPWTSSLMIGGTFIPQAYKGVLVQGRVGRLLTGRTRSLIRPDLYAFGGVAMMNLSGPASLAFQVAPADAAQIIAAFVGGDSGVTLGALQLGLDGRLGQRIGFSVAGEYYPALRNSTNIGFRSILGVHYHAVNTEVTVCF